MSVSFELVSDAQTKWLGLDAYGTELFVELAETDSEDDIGIGMTLTGAQARQLRRFLEWCYPASEDEPHGPDPWEKGATISGELVEGTLCINRGDLLRLPWLDGTNAQPITVEIENPPAEWSGSFDVYGEPEGEAR